MKRKREEYDIINEEHYNAQDNSDYEGETNALAKLISKKSEIQESLDKIRRITGDSSESD